MLVRALLHLAVEKDCEALRSREVAGPKVVAEGGVALVEEGSEEVAPGVPAPGRLQLLLAVDAQPREPAGHDGDEGPVPECDRSPLHGTIIRLAPPPEAAQEDGRGARRQPCHPGTGVGGPGLATEQSPQAVLRRRCEPSPPLRRLAPVPRRDGGAVRRSGVVVHPRRREPFVGGGSLETLSRRAPPAHRREGLTWGAQPHAGRLCVGDGVEGFEDQGRGLGRRLHVELVLARRGH
mmetsp:Transcript_32921/g.80791  ORF Transcript_32921/g.80791 Transcript_32921/m.80791 type:complete len:236 (-) Transcript_32921:414-1121(-)